MGWSRGNHRKQLSCLVALVALSATSLAACAEEPAPPRGTEDPPNTFFPIQPGITPITPDFQELPLDPTSGPAETLPWHLIRVDHQENRIYLSAPQAGCSTPEKVRLKESPSQITITVTGSSAKEPCTMQHVTMIGYVQIESIGARQVSGNSS